MPNQPYEKWKAFWSKESHPHHAHASDEWFDKYSKEVLFYLNGSKTIVDTGCGSGEILIRLSAYFEKIIAIDYSPKMIEEANAKILQKGYTNIETHVGDILNIDSIINSKVDCIYNFSVVQYLNPYQLNQFIAKCCPFLAPMGKIVLMHIADSKYKDLYTSGFFKTTVSMPLIKALIKNLRFKFYLLKKKIRNPKYQYDDGIGYWYSYAQITSIALSNNLNAEFTHSMYPPYGYRYNAILSKKND